MSRRSKVEDTRIEIELDSSGLQFSQPLLDKLEIGDHYIVVHPYEPNSFPLELVRKDHTTLDFLSLRTGPVGFNSYNIRPGTALLKVE